MIHPITFVTLLTFLCPVAVDAGSPTPASAETPPLPLETRVTPQATFLIDPALLDVVGPLVDRMSAGLREHAEQNAKGPTLAADREDYLTAINRLLGQDPDTAAREQQAEVFDFFAFGQPVRFAPGDRLRVTVVQADTAKAYLRAGGSLPHSTYDIATDSVEVKFQLHAGKATPAPFLEELFVPVRPESDLPSAGDFWFQTAEAAREPGLLIALHEVAESTFVLPWVKHRADPHWRWFSDGLATAVALRVMDEAGDHEAAATARQVYATARYADLRNELNLRYWLEATHQPKVDAYGEARLNSARYAFALEEVQRLMDTHGTDWIARVIADLNHSPTPGSQAILDAIQRHTGEVMDERLDRYQPFATAEEGIARYTIQMSEARRFENQAAALPPAIRRLEIAFNPADPRTRQIQRVILNLLLDLGQTEQAKRVRHQFFPAPTPESAPER